MTEQGVVIITKDADADIVKEVCAGIEEEGVNYCFAEAEASSSAAAEMSAFRCGILITGASVELTVQGVQLRTGNPRETGHNAGRFIKRRRLVGC